MKQDLALQEPSFTTDVTTQLTPETADISALVHSKLIGLKGRFHTARTVHACIACYVLTHCVSACTARLGKSSVLDC